jgi:hypothetical protein
MDETVRRMKADLLAAAGFPRLPFAARLAAGLVMDGFKLGSSGISVRAA